MGMSKQTAFVLMLLLAFSVVVPGSAGYLSVKMEAIGQAHRELLSLENRLHRERLAARIKRVERTQRHRRTQSVASGREPCTSARGSEGERDGSGTAGRRPPPTSSVVPARAGPGASRPRDGWIRRRWFHDRWQDVRRQDGHRRQAEDRWSRWQARDLQERDLAARPHPVTGAAGPGRPGGTYETGGITGMGDEAAVRDPYEARPERRGRVGVPGEGLTGDRRTDRPFGLKGNLETDREDDGESGEETGREDDGMSGWGDRGGTRGRLWRDPGSLAPGPAVAGGGSLPGQGGGPLTDGLPSGPPQSGSRPN